MNQEIVTFAEVNKFHVDKLYVDKFWNNINNKHWLYVDEELIKWVGYKESNGKFKYIDLIKKNFKNGEEFKIYDYDELTQIFHSPRGENEKNEEILRFKDKLTNVHNRTQHLIISPRCFKKSLMMIKTKRANEIRDYYVDVEELCIEFNKYLIASKNKELEIKNDENNKIKKDSINLIKNNEFRTQSLIDSYIGKPVVYLTAVDKDIIKFGYSNRSDGKIKEHMRFFESFDILFIQECYNNKLIENKIKFYAKSNDKLISKNIKEKNITELIQVDNEFTLNKLIETIKYEIKQQKINDIENYKRMELENVELQEKVKNMGKELELTDLILKNKDSEIKLLEMTILNKDNEIKLNSINKELCNKNIECDILSYKLRISELELQLSKKINNNLYNTTTPEITQSVIPKQNKNVTIVKKYIEENLVELTDNCVSTDDIYNDFVNWCTTNKIYTTITAKGPLTTVIIANSNFKSYRKKECGIRTNSLLHCKFV